MLTPLFECLFGCGTEKKNIWTHMGKTVSASLAVNLFLLGPMLYFYFEIPAVLGFFKFVCDPGSPGYYGNGAVGFCDDPACKTDRYYFAEKFRRDTLGV